jgi:renierapurpurin 18,18'-hydroxylase
LRGRAHKRTQAAHDLQGADWNQEVFPVIHDLRALLTSCGAADDIGARPKDRF